jgi:hypothetical protein
MNIVVCASMTLSKRLLEIERELTERGHAVVLPEHTHDYASLPEESDIHLESAHNKIKEDLIRGYFAKIAKGDCILVVNETRRGIENYIGGNSFLEMGFAHVLEKQIYLLNPIPDMPYTDEIVAMRPIVIHGDLETIR